ncbi:MAG: DUF1937 family protein [Rhodospirillales bacterium]|nr:DUF1937 family protein [Rhodospirillales bacterium]
MTPRLYVAHPYTGQEDDAYHAALWFCACAFRRGWHPYSPIVHWHVIAASHNLPTDAATWAGINERELRQSDALAVLKLTGWQNSEGLRMELAWAELYGLPVRWFEWTHQAGWIEVTP